MDNLRAAQFQVKTKTTHLTTASGCSWTVSCICDPEGANVLSGTSSRVPVNVPGSLLDDLSHKLPDPLLFDNSLDPVFPKLEHCSFCYETSFFYSHHRTNLPILFVFDSLDTIADVYLNSFPPSAPLLRARNAFHPHAVSVLPSALRDGLNTLHIIFSSIRDHIKLKSLHHTYQEWNDPVGGISTVRTPQFLAGWDWAPRMLACSIPGNIRMIQSPVASILDVAIVQDVEIDEAPRVELHFIVEVGVREGINAADMLHVRYELVPPASDETFLEASGNANNLRTPDNLVLANTQAGELCLVGTCHLQHGARCRNYDLEAKYSDKVMWNIHAQDSNQPLRVHRYIGRLEVHRPQLWWPNGYGKQYLYTLRLSMESTCFSSVCTDNAELEDAHISLDQWEQKIGLRKLELIQNATGETEMCSYDDVHDEIPVITTSLRELQESNDALSSAQKHKHSFLFAVNGRKIFAKGANSIPIRVLYPKACNLDYDQVIKSAQEANMNMLRVWGGGIYEQEAFYDACDQRGILVWQDFMFSCSLYPGDDDFLKSCRREVQYQVSRLRNRACIALWCGNNELEQVPHDILKTDTSKKAYDSLFYEILPDVVLKDPTATEYWPSSPHNPSGYEHGFNNPGSGDTHFWDVWHARKPVPCYLKHISRFCSEFGMQSYISEAGAACFAGLQPGALNPCGPIMEAHQKNSNGNLIIQEYCQRLFRTPRDYGSLAYQSQLNQMICVRTGAEHFRRSWPYCGGALYWQLNDCWPCCSWSSIEYGGNWKALHYAARSFFAPLLVSLVHHGGDTLNICNLTSFKVDTGKFSVYASWDGPHEDIQITLQWEVLNVQTSKICESGQRDFKIEQDCSKMLTCLDVRGEGVDVRNPKDHILRVRLTSRCGGYHSDATGWFCAPRLCELKAAKIGWSIERFELNGEISEVTLRVESAEYAPFVEIFLKRKFYEEDIAMTTDEGRYKVPVAVSFSNNFFDLFPNEAQMVLMKVERATTKGELETTLAMRSLVDSYMD